MQTTHAAYATPNRSTFATTRTSIRSCISRALLKQEVDRAEATQRLGLGALRRGKEIMGHNGVGFKVHRGIGLAYERYRGCNFPAAHQYPHDDNSLIRYLNNK